MEILKCIVSFLLLFLCIWAFGRNTTKLLKKEETAGVTIILGFFVYFLLFGICALLLKLALAPLSTLSIVWSVVMAVMVVVCLISDKSRWKDIIGQIKMSFSKQWKMYLLFAIIILVQIILLERNGYVGSMWDEAYYNGDAAVSVYTNTISQYSPYTGRILQSLNARYLLETYQNFIAVICQILHLSVLMQTQTVMRAVVVVIYNLVLILIGNHLFHADRRKTAVMMLLVMLFTFFHQTIYSSAAFYFFRTSESKTILAVIILPTLFYLMLRLQQEFHKKVLWGYLLIVICASYGICMSSLYLVPLALTIYFVPQIIYRRKAGILIGYAVSLIPCAAVALFYILQSHGYFVIMVS